VHGLLIAAFSFSAISYSRLCRGVESFIPWKDYAACVFTNFTLFFMLRVSDEYKDREDDARYRTYLPVPRGLISLRELSGVALFLFSIATIINVIFYPQLLLLYAVMMAYLLLMRYEFFAGKWLKSHQVWYIISHMVIIPLADVYASSYDWRLNGAAPPTGLLYFLGVSYCNGIVLEIGRKIRTPEKEEEGVVSYTYQWGLWQAPAIWLLILGINFIIALFAAKYAGAQNLFVVVLSLLFLFSALPALLFLLKPKSSWAKMMEVMSLIWALGMYLTLGAIPFLLK
jgi:4-hydroxybenzoate polyprenyltransferase